MNGTIVAVVIFVLVLLRPTPVHASPSEAQGSGFVYQYGRAASRSNRPGFFGNPGSGSGSGGGSGGGGDDNGDDWNPESSPQSVDKTKELVDWIRDHNSLFEKSQTKNKKDDQSKLDQFEELTDSESDETCLADEKAQASNKKQSDEEEPKTSNKKQFNGSQSLKTEESRNQPNPKDRWIQMEGYPELVIRRGQAQHKTREHGHLAGLPYTVNKENKRITPKTEENVDSVMDTVERVVRDSTSVWKDGTYEGGTPTEIPAYNIYNEGENLVAVFKKSTGEFKTLCAPLREEIQDIMEKGNFGGHNYKKYHQNNSNQEFTSKNSFENDVLNFTSINPDTNPDKN